MSSTNYKNEKKEGKSYSYKTRQQKIKLKILDGMDSICKAKGPEAVRRAEYYNSYNLKATDPEGSYTGIPADPFGGKPVQDADDL